MTRVTIEDFRAAFENARSALSEHLGAPHLEPEQGRITFGGERYILVRASSMSVHFLQLISEMYPGLDRQEAEQAAASILYDIAHALGKADARTILRLAEIKEPVYKLATGPVHFAFAGWGRVEILPSSRPTPDRDYYLLYDHLDSFEAESWIRYEKRSASPRCFMNAGYSAGWCSVSFGIPLRAREMQCRACGDDRCRFIMAHEERLDDFVDAYLAEQEAGGTAKPAPNAP
jgi:predicted hydrocarbon binding protein